MPCSCQRQPLQLTADLITKSPHVLSGRLHHLSHRYAAGGLESARHLAADWTDCLTFRI